MSEVFLLNSSWNAGDSGAAFSGRESTLVLYRDDVGRISFFSDDIGRRILDGLMNGACTYAHDGSVILFRTDSSRESFLASAYARGRINFFDPDSCFVSDAALTAQYKLAQKKSGLYSRHGKDFSMPNRPIVDAVLSGEKLSFEQEEWLLSHCAGFCLWGCTVGAERAPVFLGKKENL